MATDQIIIPNIGVLAEVLGKNANITINLPNGSQAMLDCDSTGYSFTWVQYHQGEEEDWPDLSGVTFGELVSRVFDILFDRIHLKI